MKKITIILISLIVGLSSCDSYLDIVPDDIATIDNAFTMRAQAEKYLFTCYFYMPEHGVLEANPALAGGDELCHTEEYRSAAHVNAWYIAHNMQTSARPRSDYWVGADQKNNKSLYRGISDCNIFLENIQNVPDMLQEEKDRWSAEVRFLKAYYHYWMIRMYGPIPILDKNISVNSSIEDVRVYRNTIDECFDYVLNSLDEIIASNALPEKIENEAEQLGRITLGIVKAVKAEVAVTAASPLYNGNADYTGLVDNRGVEIFNPGKSDQDKKQRWIDAAKACEEAIDYLHSKGHELYKYTSLEYTISEQTRAKLTLRNIVTEKWNPEIIWANSNSVVGQLQTAAVPRSLEKGKENNASVNGNLAVPLKIANQYYTKNGVPIDEDITWDYENRFSLKKATADDKYFIQEGYTTAKLNFDRETRYYANLAFDGAIWYGQGTVDETKSIYVQCKSGQLTGNQISHSWNLTGIWPKKLVHFKSVVGASSGFTQIQYPFPVMRLGNLYLLYAEALNESGASKEEVLSWVDKIRDRAGLKGVEESWSTYTTNTKYETLEGRRSIIQQERCIELAFEAQRFWDLRRWKLAYQELNKPVTGWSTQCSTDAEYYVEQVVFNQEFPIRNYLWPILDTELYSNPNLVQNYGW